MCELTVCEFRPCLFLSDLFILCMWDRNVSQTHTVPPHTAAFHLSYLFCAGVCVYVCVCLCVPVRAVEE